MAIWLGAAPLDINGTLYSNLRCRHSLFLGESDPVSRNLFPALAFRESTRKFLGCRVFLASDRPRKAKIGEFP